MQTDLFINNEFVAPAKGARFDVINPATEEVLAQVGEAGPEGVAAAVAAARTTFESDGWRKLSARRRGAVLLKAADLLAGRLGETAELEARQNGKPLFEAKIDVSMAIEVLRYYGGWADKISGETIPVDGPYFTYTLQEPVGVVGAIVPWNFPLNIATWKVAPALAAGCTVVLKPAPETPLTALLLAEVLRDAGLPAGAFNVIPGDGPGTGGALVRHPGVDKLAFTGSTAVGKQIMREAADGMKRVTLELGGKSPNIVFSDSDVAAAVRGAQAGIFYGKGEVCAAGSRLLVEKSLKDQVVDQLVERAKKLVPGDPFAKETRLGAIVSRKQHARVMGHIEKARAEGATVVAGGSATSVNGKGFFIEATIVDGVKPDMAVAREEIFGPVLAVLPFSDEAEAVALANQSMYGLAAGIWTRDVSKAHRVARAIRAGTVWINCYNAYDPAAPFGGFKESGFGRDLGRHALDNYTETKTVWVGL